MTNEEAIRNLDTMWKMLTSAYDEMADSFVVAYTMAVEALKAQIDKDTNVPNNGDTIYRQAAIIQLSHNKKMGDDEWELAVENDIQTIWKLPPAQQEPLKITIDHAPTADELEKIKQAMRNTPVMLLPSEQPGIIKCRDCRKYRKLNCPFGITVVDAPDPDGYCYKAERRTDESD